MFFPIGMGYQPTEEDQQVIAAARIAIREKLRLLWKQAAAQVGVREAYLRDALSGSRPLKFSLLYRIEGFRRAFLDVLASEEDCVVLDRKHVRLLEMERKPQMLKASLPEKKEDVA